MDNEERYVIAWTDPEGKPGIYTIVYHDLPESDPRYNDVEFTAIRTYAKGDLNPGETIVTDFDQARELIEGTDPMHHIAVPAGLAHELGWFPLAHYQLGDCAHRFRHAA